MPDPVTNAPTNAPAGQSGPERVRAAVIQAARKMFAERGIHAVSVREIAKEVGVSHTLLHLYFGSKDEIVRQVLNTYDTSIAGSIEAADDVTAAIAQGFKKAAGQADYKVLASALLEGIVPDRVTRDAAVTRAIAARITDSDKFDPRVVGMALSSMTIGWAIASEWLKASVDVTDMSDDEVLDQMAALLEHWVSHC